MCPHILQPRVFIAMIILISSSCIGNKNLTPVISEERDVPPFQAIKVQNGIDVYITYGPKDKIKVETNENTMQYLITEVRNDVLRIYFKRSGVWFREARVYVTTNQLKEIDASGGSDVKSENTIDADDLKLKASGGSDIELAVNATNLTAEASGGADIMLSGYAVNLVAHTSGGSDLKAFDLTVDKAELEASGGSDIKITVTKELSARASGGADILYKGNPEKINVNSSASGDVKNIE